MGGLSYSKWVVPFSDALLVLESEHSYGWHMFHIIMASPTASIYSIDRTIIRNSNHSTKSKRWRKIVWYELVNEYRSTALINCTTNACKFTAAGGTYIDY